MNQKVYATPRGALMARVRQRNTVPELKVRRLLHAHGWRYQLHPNDLPGTPDIIFRPRRKAIFVHGCFWHAHEGCRLATVPKTRTDVWRKKFKDNRKRDSAKVQALADLGWSVLTVWQCETADEESLLEKLTSFLSLAPVREGKVSPNG
jgi:DNA mismatch endonuclease, patch repair protein